MAVAPARVLAALRRKLPELLLFGAGVVLVPLSTSWPPASAVPTPSVEVAEQVAADAPRSRRAPPEQLATLSGIWWRYEPGELGDPIRFYYFHGDGTGLYRYGRIGLTNTNSFDYDLVDGRLVIDFRKSGTHHELDYALHRGEPGSRDWLELRDDPREPGSTRYFRDSDEIVRPGAQLDPLAAPPGPPPAGHLWIDLANHATGGQTFALYQFRPAGIDGRGTGWFHRGDFNDWSTEWLTYRIAGSKLELHFTLADRREVTTFEVTATPDGSRRLHLADDPRDYWHPHRYVDAGPSFGTAHPEIASLP